MRIAQVAPLVEAVPPKLYGGTERIVSYLTEALVDQGHDVTLFAAGDSVTRAKLEPMTPRALRLDGRVSDPVAPTMLMIERVVQQADRFDVIHFHLDYLPLPVARRIKTPTVTTLHGRLDLPELKPVYAEFRDAPLVSISDTQRAPLPDVRWLGTVHHGLPIDLLHPTREPEGYLAFLGRIAPEKGPDAAIRIARRAGRVLRIAAKVDAADREYFETVVRPMLDQPGIEFIGEIAEAQKGAFLGNAAALLFPIDWPEPFGLVMIEAMACGTPVIAYRRGSVPEVIDDGITGLIVEGEDAAVHAVDRVPQLDRSRVRRVFERQFTSARMAYEYTALYRQLQPARTRGIDRADLLGLDLVTPLALLEPEVDEPADPPDLPAMLAQLKKRGRSGGGPRELT
jgi:glycosyltransferase involved in cell wall biosynthesis